MRYRALLTSAVFLGMILASPLKAWGFTQGITPHTIFPVHHRPSRNHKEKVAGWYLRTVVSATLPDGKTYTHNTAGVFGELSQSRNKKDRHDIPSYGLGIIYVLFTPTNWGEESGDYFSDYRHYNRHRLMRRQVWTFQVKNQYGVDLSGADLKIGLEGPVRVLSTGDRKHLRYRETAYPHPERLLSRLTLVDVDNGTTYTVDELPYADLSMEGKHTRTFRWVLGPVRKRDFLPVQ